MSWNAALCSGVREKRVSLYEMPSLYDILHAPGTAAEVDGLERIAERYVRTPPRVQTWLEPACGTGRYLRVAASRGRRVIGVDRSGEMLAYARRRLEGLRCGGAWRLINSDMRDLSGVRDRSVGFAFNLINSIRHLERDADVIDHLKSMARVLRRGGVYVVGMSLSAYGLEGPTVDVWEGVRGRCQVKQVVRYVPAFANGRSGRFERVVSRLTVTRPSGVRHYNSTYRLRTYSGRQWSGVVSRSAMRRVATVNERGEHIHVVKPGYGLWVLTAR